MGFKKLTEKEINSAEYENLIGIAKRDEKIYQNIDSHLVSSSTPLSGTSKIQTGILSKEGKKIPILIENIDQIESNSNGEIQKINRHSTLVIKNPSASEKLWNITLEMNDGSNPFQITEISPNKEWKATLDEKEKIEQVPLLLRKVISRNNYPSDLSSQSELMLDKNGVNTLFITIFAKNQTKTVFKDLEIVKEFPISLVRINDSKCSQGQVNQEKNKIKWSITELAPNSMASTNIKFQINPKAVRTGVLSASFQFQYNQYMLDIKNFSGSAKIVQFINVSEQDENPGFWDCTLDVSNRSEIFHTIKYAELFKQDGNDLKSLAKIETGMDLNPFEEKNLLKTTLHQASQPNLSKSIEILPQYTFSQYMKCVESFEDEKFDFLDLSIQKTFSVEDIKSYEANSFDCLLKIQNLSSIPLNHLLIHEIVPLDFNFGNLSQITLELKNQSLKFENYKKTQTYSSPHEEIDAIEKQLLTIQNNIEDLEKQQKDLATTINSINIDQLNSEIESLHNSEQQKSAELQKLKENLKSTQTKMDNLQKSFDGIQKRLENEQKILDDLNIKKGLIESISVLEKELNEKENVRNNLKSQKDQIENDLKNTDAVANPSQYTELSQKLESISNQYADTSKNADECKRKLQDAQKAQKSKESIEQIANKITEQSAKVTTAGEELMKVQNDLNPLKTESNMIENNIKVVESEINSINEGIIQKQDSITKVTSSQSQENHILAQIKELDLKNNQYRFRKDLLVKITTNSSDVTHLIEFIMNMYTSSKNVIEYDGFDVFKIETATEIHLLIQISNIEKLISTFNENDILSITYPIDAIRPRNDVNYAFPTKIYYLGHAGGEVREYVLSQEKCPRVNIIHLRKKISLGKIVDNYNEANKFAITIIARNPGKTPIENVVILDSLPVEAEIFNAVKNFEEKPLSSGLKQIIWQIPHLAPYEEIEISYLVDLHGKICDLNRFNLVFE